MVSKKSDGVVGKGDLSNFSCITSDEGAWCELVTPAGEALVNDAGERMRIRVVGTDSGIYRSIQYKVNSRRVKRRALIPSLEEQHADNLDLLAESTVGWEHMQEGGAGVDFSVAAARRLYSQYPFIFDQIDRFMADRTNFLPK